MADAKTRSIGVAGKTFVVEDIYSEGDTLNAAEANALNQMRAENLRNNMRNAITTAVEEGKTDEDLEVLFNEYVEKYEFGARKGGGRRVTDPLEKELRRLAIEAIKPALVKAGTTWAACSGEQRDKLLEKFWAKPNRKEEMTPIAEANLKQLSAIAEATIEI